MKKHLKRFTMMLAGFALAATGAQAQQVLQIPGATAVTGSYTHLYVLSSADGLAVFRAYPDSLTWLYTSDALLRRGSTLRSDARFAYLYGSGNRITVIDATMPQAMYSATTLPADPLGVTRVGNRLYLAMGAQGLGTLSLASPDEVDNTFEILPMDRGRNESVLGIVSSSNRIFVLGNTGTIYPFLISAGKAVQDAPVTTGLPLTSIHGTGDAFLLSTDDGRLFSWKRGGQPIPLPAIDGNVTDAYPWHGGWLVRTGSGQIWHTAGDLETGTASMLRDNGAAGNYITVNKDAAFVSEFGRVSPLIADIQAPASESGGVSRTAPKIAPVQDLSLPFPQPVIASFALTDGGSQQVSWFVRHHRTGPVRVRGSSMLWQPSGSDIGQNIFTIVASDAAGRSDSTRFTVDVRQYNAPPQLVPVRPVSIPVNEEYRLQLTGLDPDGTSSELVRFSGINLPEGINLDSQTGLLTWTPNDRQLGRHVLQIVTSDQYGASMSNEIILNVIRLRR